MQTKKKKTTRRGGERQEGEDGTLGKPQKKKNKPQNKPSLRSAGQVCDKRIRPGKGPGRRDQLLIKSESIGSRGKTKKGSEQLRIPYKRFPLDWKVGKKTGQPKKKFVLSRTPMR